MKKAVKQDPKQKTVAVIAENRIRSLRERSRLTQEELAVLTGIDGTTISKHETTARGIDDEALTRYARVFKVSSHELFLVPDNPDTYNGREWAQYQAGSPTKR